MRGTIAKESIGRVFKRSRWLLLVLSALLGVFVLSSSLMQLSNQNKRTIHTGVAAAKLNLTPIAAPAQQEVSGTVLTETTRVETSYFDDALFAGDSLTDGIRIYDVFAGFKTVTKVGISPQTATTTPFYETEDGRELTMVEAIEYLQPKKLYVMLGTNGLNWASIESLISGYDEFLDAVQTRMPNLDIIIESIPPTTLETATERPSYTKENVDAYNAALLELAMKRGLYFLDVHAAVVGSDGYLPEDIAAPDGIHFQISGYSIWKDYLHTHTIQGNAAFSFADDGSIVYTKNN